METWSSAWCSGQAWQTLEVKIGGAVAAWTSHVGLLGGGLGLICLSQFGTQFSISEAGSHFPMCIVWFPVT
jgi:hypothetical protein